MLALLLPLLASPLLQGDEVPGLVFVPGGSTAVGAEVEATIERIRKKPADANFLAGETPRSMVEVAPYYIAPTPVTNEMYLSYVEATGATPPSSWADISKEMRAELILAGKEEFGPAYKFDESAQNEWWKAHWQDEGITWSVPGERALEPVVFVTYQDALDYCRWAGLRLPTEPEWVRAARGDSSNDFPWGNEEDNTKAIFDATMPRKLAAKRLPVGSMANASVFGVFDMAGHVFEYTSTKAEQLEGYRSFEVTFLDEKGKVESMTVPSPTWDLTMVVLKGGSFLNPLMNCRVDARIPFRGDSAAPVLGFRVAASANPYADIAIGRTQGIRSKVFDGYPEDALALSESVGLLKREMADMELIRAKRKQHEDYPEASGPPESYAVFGAVTAVTATPAIDPFGGDFKQAAVATIERLMIKEGMFPVVGALVTTLDLAEPRLAAGAYSLRYMPGMKKRELERIGAWVKGEDAPDPEVEIDTPPIVSLSEVEIMPGTQPLLLVINADNQVVGQIKVKGNKLFLKKTDAVKHGVVLDPDREAMDISLRLPGKSKKSYELSFTVKPVDSEGHSVANPVFWERGD